MCVIRVYSLAYQEPPRRSDDCNESASSEEHLNAPTVDEEPEDLVHGWIDALERGELAQPIPTAPEVLPEPATAEDATALLARFRVLRVDVPR